MAQEHSVQSQGKWARLDASAFGVIYGSVTVLALLMAIEAHPESAVTSAVVLFGSVLAITLAKAFADVMSSAIDRGTRITRRSFSDAWSHARPTLIAANLPTLLLFLAASGVGTFETAVAIAQVYCICLLMLVGGRVGWRLDGVWVSALLGAVFAGGIGLALALLKYAIH